jgi:flagellar basal-body rod protein FlgF
MESDNVISGIHNVLDGAMLQKLRFDNIANNLANISTNAFKKDILSFNQTLSMQYICETDFSPGPIIHTGNKLDVALASQGFFKIQTSSGIRYTRNGSFSLNSEGFLVTQNDDKVLGQNGPIKINGSDISIGSDGQVFVDNGPVDRILVVDSKQPQLLKKEGGSYYIYQGGDEGLFQAENVDIKQSYLEKSNVNPTEEMIKMMETFRAYESAQKAIQCMDEMTSKLINVAGMQ